MESVHDHYRRQFREKILALKPKSVLDVGCGDGALIRFLQNQGVEATGLDTDPDSVEQLQSLGLDITQGRAENLPMQGSSVDMVVSEFSLHHFEDFGAAVADCMRVARKHVLFLDGWYDPTVASQNNACTFDRWMKSIDRKAGEIHNDVLSAGGIWEAVLGSGQTVDFQYENWLQLMPMDQAKFERLCDESLGKCADDPDVKRILIRLKANIDRHGISEDGALFAALSRQTEQ